MGSRLSNYFLQKYNFRPYYHTDNDVVANINGLYCAEIVRLVCGMLLHAIETPAKVANLHIFDVGNGNQILAKFNASVEPDVVQYKLFVGEACSTYDTVFYTTDTAFTVSGLTENIKYYIGVAAVDSENI